MNREAPTAAMRDRYQRFLERYRSGQVPWDQGEPPPELVALAAELPPGRALDLGCGFGRAALHLARLGWRVDAVDFVAEAVAEAGRRVAAAGLGDRVTLHLGDIRDLAFLDGPYDLALDVGTLHSLDEAGTRACHAELSRLLRPGGRYLLFAHLQQPGAEPEDDRRWMEEATMRAIFAEGFALERVEHGLTQVGDNPPWPSAWYWFRREGD